MRWTKLLRSTRRPNGDPVELAVEIRLIRKQLAELNVTLRDFDERLTTVAEQIQPDRTTMEWKETPGE